MTDFHAEFFGKPFNDLSPVTNFPNELADIILKYPNKLSKLGYNFLLLLIANIKEDQIIKNKGENAKNFQLDLFDTKLFDISDNSDQTKVLNFHYSDFLEKGDKNYDQVKKGIDELMNFKYSLTIDLNKSSSKFPDYKPRIVTFNSSLILNYVHEERKGFKILIDKHWYRIFINLTDGFNPILLKSMAFNIKSDRFFPFFLWVLKLPLITETSKTNYKVLYEKLGDAAIKIKGTIIKTENLIKTFELPYKHESQISRDFLEPIRNQMNKISNISFNYKFENNKFYIITYPGNQALIKEGIFKKETVKIKMAINYKVKKYHLNEMEAIFLIEIYLKYGYDFVLKATDKKKSLKGLSKSDYYNEFIKLVNEKFDLSTIPLDILGYTQQEKTTIRHELFKKFGANQKVDILDQE